MNSEIRARALGRTKSLVRIAMFTALTAALGFIKIPLFVPFTLQTMACMLAGLLLTRREAVSSQLLYIVLGLVGIPIFTRGGGIGYVLEPTFGYLLFLPVMAYMISSMSKTGLRSMFVCFFAGVATLMFGTAYMAIILQVYLKSQTTIYSIIISGLVTFIPAELLKAVASGLLADRLKPILSVEKQN